MSYKMAVLFFLCITSVIKPVCFSTVAGENQWRSVHRVGICLEQLESVTESIDQGLLSVNDVLLSAIDACCSNSGDALLSVSDALTSQISNIDTDLLSVGDVLLSAIESCCSNSGDALLSVSDALTSQISNIDTDLLSVSDVLLSAIESCCSNSGDALLSVSDVLSSKIMGVDTDLLSVSDVLLSAIDAINVNVQVSCNDNAALLLSISDVLSSKITAIDTELTSISDSLISAIDVLNGGVCSSLVTFNDACDANRIDYIALEFNYGLPGDQVSTTIVGSAAVTETAGEVVLSTPAAGDAVTVTTPRTVPVNPGDEAYAIFGVQFNRAVAVSTQRIGLFDTVNGMAVGFGAATNAPFSILYRNASVDTVVNQNAFNVDHLDGTGPSGFVYNSATFNTFRLSSIWYGTNLIRYQILGTNGEWITFHQIANVNTQTTSAFSNPYLPMTMQQRATVTTSDQLVTTAWRAGVVHSGENNAGTRTFAYNNGALIALLTGELTMFTLTNKTTFSGETNRVMIRLARVGGGNGINNITPVILRYYKNATVNLASGPSDINTANSVVSVTTGGTRVAGTGHLLWMSAAPIGFELTPTEAIEFYIGPGETITVTAEQLAGIAGIALYATALWEELQ